MRRVVFGLLVGAVICALAIRLTMDVAKIAALDVEEGTGVVLRLRKGPPAVQRSRTPPPAPRGSGAEPAS
jgi:hypothetical protein